DRFGLAGRVTGVAWLGTYEQCPGCERQRDCEAPKLRRTAVDPFPLEPPGSLAGAAASPCGDYRRPHEVVNGRFVRVGEELGVGAYIHPKDLVLNPVGEYSAGAVFGQGPAPA